MPVVAFATYRQSPRLTDDDALVARVLAERGIDVHAVPWNGSDVDWDRFDRVIIRSAWDFHLAPGAYEEWLRRFFARPQRLWNPPTVVLANLNKRYLIDLARHGIDVVPTAHVEAGGRQSLLSVIEQHGWDEVVIKPAVSASAQGTWRSARAAAAADEDAFAAARRTHDMLVQPYCHEVASKGEWSMIFFDGAYSHAVLKRPADGDFRVQRHFGGTPVAAAPDARLIAQASRILSTLGERPLYARVDGIEREGRFVLMELELNEPFLFLAQSKAGPTRFADAIARLLGA